MAKKISFLAVMLFLVLILAVPQASAQRLLGTTSTGTSDDPDTSTLVEIDPANGNLISTIGDVGYAVNGMTWDETTGTLYATTSLWDPVFPSGLIIIDPLTGAGTPVGTGAGRCVNVPASNAAGQVYAWTETSGRCSGGDDLALFDKVAGTATRVGESAISTGGQGLAFDASDTLYLVNYGGDVYTMDTGTGASTFVGTISGLPGEEMAHHGDFHPISNLYYGIDAAFGWDGVTARNLLVINIGTLSLVNTIPTVDNLQTLTFIPDATPSQSIPTLSEWGFIIMSLILVGSALLMMRRRQLS